MQNDTCGKHLKFSLMTLVTSSRTDLILLTLLAMLAACSPDAKKENTTASPNPTQTVQPVATPTPLPTPKLTPTPTPAPTPTPTPTPTAKPSPTPKPEAKPTTITVQTPTSAPKVAPSPAPTLPTSVPGPSKPIGTLNVGEGAWIKFFTTLPGSQGKPNSKVGTVTEDVPVYEIYDWAEHHEELRGQSGHVWYRVNAEKGNWIFGLENHKYTPLKPE